MISQDDDHFVVAKHLLQKSHQDLEVVYDRGHVGLGGIFKMGPDYRKFNWFLGMVNRTIFDLRPVGNIARLLVKRGMAADQHELNKQGLRAFLNLGAVDGIEQN